MGEDTGMARTESVVRRTADRAEAAVPRQLKLAAGLSWRFLVVVAAVGVIALTLARLRVVILPVVFALFAAAVLASPTTWLRERRVPRTLAALTVVVGAVVVIAGVIALLAPRVAAEIGDIGQDVEEGISTVTDWLLEGPLELTRVELDQYREDALDELRARAGDIAGGVLGGAYLVVEIVAGIVLALFLLFFFLRDGDRLWPWIVRLFPPEARAEVDEVGRITWDTLGSYLRGVTLVAVIDAVFIGLALWLIGVPFVLPLAVLTFIGGFFPVLGAFAAGGAAALIALVANGPLDALLVVIATFVVQQLEGNLLQPIIVGRAVQIHPVAVILAVASGAVIWGVAGAILAVPIVAVVSRAASYLRSGSERTTTASPPPDAPARSPAAAPPA
jgi:predicted PurR-regulated permease PerM